MGLAVRKRRCHHAVLSLLSVRMFQYVSKITDATGVLRSLFMGVRTLLDLVVHIGELNGILATVGLWWPFMISASLLTYIVLQMKCFVLGP